MILNVINEFGKGMNKMQAIDPKRDPFSIVVKKIYIASLTEMEKRNMEEAEDSISLNEERHKITVDFAEGIKVKILYKKALQLDDAAKYSRKSVCYITYYPTPEGICFERDAISYYGLSYTGIVDRVQKSIYQLEKTAACLLDFPDYWENDKIMDIFWPGTNQKDEVCETNE